MWITRTKPKPSDAVAQKNGQPLATLQAEQPGGSLTFEPKASSRQ